MSRSAPILIAGPTASGKSALALALAERLGGVVINADSMQVYRELRVLTARPTVEDESRVPHKLYGHVPASEAYSVGRFVEDAAGALAEARSNSLRPIFVGGTGLYFKALLEGLSPIPPVDPAVRAHWRTVGEHHGAATLHAELLRRDPDMAARLRPSDTQRLVRALEVLDSTGRSLRYWQEQPGTPVIDDVNTVKLVVQPPRSALHKRADVRFADMVAAGGLVEAQRLSGLDLAPDLPAMRAIGVAPLIAASQGEITLAEAIERGRAETRQYIKRQETWLKRHMIAWNELEAQETESNFEKSIPFIQS